MHIVTKTKSDDQTLRVSVLAASLGWHDRGYHKPAEIAADAKALIDASDEVKRMRSQGRTPLDANKTIIELANKHCAHAKFNRTRHLAGLILSNNFIPIP